MSDHVGWFHFYNYFRILATGKLLYWDYRDFGVDDEENVWWCKRWSRAVVELQLHNLFLGNFLI